MRRAHAGPGPKRTDPAGSQDRTSAYPHGSRPVKNRAPYSWSRAARRPTAVRGHAGTRGSRSSRACRAAAPFSATRPGRGASSRARSKGFRRRVARSLPSLMRTQARRPSAERHERHGRPCPHDGRARSIRDGNERARRITKGPRGPAKYRPDRRNLARALRWRETDQV